MNIDEIKQTIKDYDYVSFDIFDTLIFRSVAKPEDVFYMVEQLYNNTHNKKISCFKKNRIKAEKRARYKKYGKDVNLDDIYSILNYDHHIKKELKQLECQYEINNCLANSSMLSLAAWCKSQGKTIIIITDMYLDRNTISQILSKIGCEYDKLYISGEIGQTKRQGCLFQYVLNDLSINPSSLVHFGDNELSDIENPSKYGIKSIERLADFDSAIIEIATTFLTPLCRDFCFWIHKKKEEEQIDKLCFIAREGYLLKKVYDIMYPSEKEQTAYMRLNKNILRFPLLSTGDPLISFINSIPMRTKFTWNEIFRYLNIGENTSIYDSIYKKYPIINDNKAWDSKLMYLDGDYKDVIEYALNLIKPDIEKQTSLLLKYLKMMEFGNKRIGLVNNSINGNGQYMIQYFFEQHNLKAQVHGFQFSSSKKCKELLKNQVSVWIDDKKMPHYYNEVIRLYCLVLEHLLFEPTGTSQYLYESNNTVEVKTENQRLETFNNKIIEKIQQFVILSIRNNMGLEMPNKGMHAFARAILTPSKNVAKIIGNIYDDDYNGDKRINECDNITNGWFVLKKHIPSNIVWPQGVIVSKGLGNIFLLIINVRFLLKYFFSRNKHYQLR